MRLVTILTENYLSRARPFLQSIQQLTGVEKIAILLGPIRYAVIKSSGLSFFFMDRHWSESSPGIFQHGRWLDALPDVRDDEVYILSDADIVIQRDFTQAEREMFESCGEDSFLAGWNAHVGDTLFEEAERIGMKPDTSFGEIGSWGACFNTGVLAMRGRNWKRLRDLYESRCERFYQSTSHRSRGQFLICWCLSKLGLTPKVLPFETHLHGHFGVPPGGVVRDGIAYYEDKMVLFRHAM